VNFSSAGYITKETG